MQKGRKRAIFLAMRGVQYSIRVFVSCFPDRVHTTTHTTHTRIISYYINRSTAMVHNCPYQRGENTILLTVCTKLQEHKIISNYVAFSICPFQINPNQQTTWENTSAKQNIHETSHHESFWGEFTIEQNIP